MSIVTVELTVPSEQFDLGRILHDGTDVQIELAQFVPIGEFITPYFWVETSDPSSFEKAVRNDDYVATLERLDDGTNKYLYRIEWEIEPDGFLTALRLHDLVVERATGTRDEWRFHIRGPDNENLSAFRETLREQGVSFTVEAIWYPNEPIGNQSNLSNKQRQAVELAFTEGYWSVPKETNLSELAEQVGISRQSFSRRLDRGIYNILAAATIRPTRSTTESVSEIQD